MQAVDLGADDVLKRQRLRQSRLLRPLLLRGGVVADDQAGIKPAGVEMTREQMAGAEAVPHQPLNLLGVTLLACLGKPPGVFVQVDRVKRKELDKLHARAGERPRIFRAGLPA